MASQPPNLDLAVAEFNSFIRGYHVYSQIWDPAFGEVLILEREPNNAVDSSAVAVKKEHKTVGHIPYTTASVISHFLMRDCNKGFVEVTGRKVNRGAGYGLEIPCIYRLYGPKPYTDRIQDIVTTLQRNGMCV
jgi:hypothetical protein